MIQIGAVASENTNLTLSGNAASGTVDSTYSYAGRSRSNDVGTATMNFADFVDMINPLQHIPVLSSVYRALTEETINPVSRIAGDALYGGVLGLASAGLSALGAIGDEVVTANNDGQSTSASLVAALFGKDDNQATQIASAAPEKTETTQEPTQVASLQTPAPVVQTPDLSSTAPQTAGTDSSVAVAGGGSSSDKGMPLDRAKQPYGGVMDSSMMANAQQNQTLALAMAGRREALQAQHSLRNNRFATGTAAPAAATATPTQPEADTQAAMQNLIKELQAMKGVAQYRNSAQSTPIPGGAVNFVN